MSLHWFYNFSILTWKIFRCSHKLYHSPVLARIRLFFGTQTDSTIFRYLFGKLFDTRTDSTIVVTRLDYTLSWYTLGFKHFPILKLILPFFGTLSDSYSILARILPLPSSRPDSIIFWYSHWFYHFSILAWKVFVTFTDYTLSWYSPGFDHFPVLKLILPFFSTRSDSYSILARILPLPGSLPDSIIFLS